MMSYSKLTINSLSGKYVAKLQNFGEVQCNLDFSNLLGK